MVKLARIVVDGEMVCSCEPEMEEEPVEEFMADGELRLDKMKRVALVVMDTVTVPEWVIGDKDGDWEAWVEGETAEEVEGKRVTDSAVEEDL